MNNISGIFHQEGKPESEDGNLGGPKSDPNNSMQMRQRHAKLKKSNFQNKDVQSDESDFSESDLPLKETEEGCQSKILNKSYNLIPFLESFDRKVHAK